MHGGGKMRLEMTFIFGVYYCKLKKNIEFLVYCQSLKQLNVMIAFEIYFQIFVEKMDVYLSVWKPRLNGRKHSLRSYDEGYDIVINLLSNENEDAYSWASKFVGSCLH